MGLGIGTDLQILEQLLKQNRQDYKNVNVVKLVGHSRGALRAVQMADIFAKYLPHCKIELTLRDPVIGHFDHLGVSTETWRNKFTVPANVSKFVVKYSGIENRTIFRGVVAPNRFKFLGKNTSILTMVEPLDHAQINSPHSENILLTKQLTQNPKASFDSIASTEDMIRLNDKRRAASLAFDLVEAGIKPDYQKEERIQLKKFLREEAARSEQRSPYDFNLIANENGFSGPTRKLIADFKKEAVFSIQVLKKMLLLTNPQDPFILFTPLMQEVKDVLGKDVFLRQVMGILQNDELPDYEKVRKINRIVNRDPQPNNPIVRAVSEVVNHGVRFHTLSGRPLPKDNWLVRFDKAATEFRGSVNIANKYRGNLSEQQHAQLTTSACQLRDITNGIEPSALNGSSSMLDKFLKVLSDLFKSVRIFPEAKVDNDRNGKRSYSDSDLFRAASRPEITRAFSDSATMKPVTHARSRVLRVETEVNTSDPQSMQQPSKKQRHKP